PALRFAAVFAAPHGWRAARTGARHWLKGHDVYRVGVVRVDHYGKSEVRRQSLGDRSPRAAVDVAAQHGRYPAAAPRARSNLPTRRGSPARGGTYRGGADFYHRERPTGKPADRHRFQPQWRLPAVRAAFGVRPQRLQEPDAGDRKSTRLNS